jgi:hypothetical protein
VERKNHDLSESNFGKKKSSFSAPPPPSPEETQKFEWSSGTKKTDPSKLVSHTAYHTLLIRELLQIFQT